jgi:hypothetical protein
MDGNSMIGKTRGDYTVQKEFLHTSFIVYQVVPILTLFIIGTFLKTPLI